MLAAYPVEAETLANEDAEHGRGLLLVEAVSKQWDWFPAEPDGPGADGHRGKVVLAVVS